MDDPGQSVENAQTGDSRRRYVKPELTVHGTVNELTQSGGNRVRDGIFTRAPS